MMRKTTATRWMCATKYILFKKKTKKKKNKYKRILFNKGGSHVNLSFLGLFLDFSRHLFLFLFFFVLFCFFLFLSTLFRGKGPCKGCSKDIEGKFLQVGRDYFHPECFVCSGCQCNLGSGKPATIKEGKFVCNDCVGGEMCQRCKKQIVLGQASTKVQEFSFHSKTCLTCLDCGKGIEKDRLFISAKDNPRDIRCPDHVHV
jgi:hypothetical protein